MKVRFTFFIVFIAVSLSLVSVTHAEEGRSSTSDEWQKIVSEEGLFFVEMPTLPTFKTRTRQYAVGDIMENLYELETRDSEFTAEYTDLPGFVMIFGRRIIYRMAKRNFLRESRAVEIDFSNFDLGPLDGKELLFEIGRNGKTPAREGKARFVLAGKRLYVITAAADKDSPAVDSIDRFLDSFEILARFTKRKPHKYQEMQKGTLSPETMPAEIPPESVVPPDELMPE